MYNPSTVLVFLVATFWHGAIAKSFSDPAGFTQFAIRVIIEAWLSIDTLKADADLPSAGSIWIQGLAGLSTCLATPRNNVNSVISLRGWSPGSLIQAINMPLVTVDMCFDWSYQIWSLRASFAITDPVRGWPLATYIIDRILTTQETKLGLPASIVTMRAAIPGFDIEVSGTLDYRLFRVQSYPFNSENPTPRTSCLERPTPS